MGVNGPWLEATCNHCGKKEIFCYSYDTGFDIFTKLPEYMKLAGWVGGEQRCYCSAEHKKIADTTVVMAEV